MKRSSVYLVVVLWLALVGCAPGATPTALPSVTPQPSRTVESLGPSPFASIEGGFSVEAPVTLAESIEATEAEAGSLEVHTFSGTAGDTSYVVVYTDYPAGYGAKTAKEMLDAARDGQVQVEKGSLIAEGSAATGGHVGREVRIQLPDTGTGNRILRGAFFWVGTRLYRVLAYAPAEVADGPEVTAFLDSFQFRDRAD